MSAAAGLFRMPDRAGKGRDHHRDMLYLLHRRALCLVHGQPADLHGRPVRTGTAEQEHPVACGVSAMSPEDRCPDVLGDGVRSEMDRRVMSGPVDVRLDDPLRSSGADPEHRRRIHAHRASVVGRR